MKYENRAALLRAAADSIEMQVAAEVEPVCKIQGGLYPIKSINIGCDIYNYEFPLAVVEGRQVWAGDKLWCGDMEIIADHTNGNSIYAKDGAYVFLPNPHLSWSPPKPKTVMVELSVHKAEVYRGFEDRELAEACRKALEKLK